jgi:hypothetical protein
MTFCSTIAFVTVRVLKVVKSVNMPRRDYVRRVMPIGALYAASLWLSNSAYLHLSVSFIQMTKALMPGLVYATASAGAALLVSRAFCADAAHALPGGVHGHGAVHQHHRCNHDPHRHRRGARLLVCCRGTFVLCALMHASASLLTRPLPRMARSTLW